MSMIRFEIDIVQLFDVFRMIGDEPIEEWLHGGCGARSCAGRSSFKYHGIRVMWIFGGPKANVP